MDDSFIKNVIAALRLMKDAVMIFISSPGPVTGYYAQLMQNPRFSVIKFTMACAACQKSKAPWKCTHKVGEIPHWQNEESIEEAKQLLADDPLIQYRELMGGSLDDAAKVFSREQLNELENRPEVGLNMKKPKFVFIAVDPAGGGSSHFAICSCFYAGPVAVVSFINGVIGQFWVLHAVHFCCVPRVHPCFCAFVSSTASVLHWIVFITGVMHPCLPPSAFPCPC